MTAARPSATGTPGYTETMPCEPESARRARTLVRAALSTWDIGDLAEAGLQIVAELITNTIEHTRCRSVRVLVTRPTEGVVRIGVADTCPVVPEAGHPDDDAEDGRGLLVVEALSWRWGYDRTRCSTSDSDTAMFAEPLRITPSDLPRLHMDFGQEPEAGQSDPAPRGDRRPMTSAWHLECPSRSADEQGTRRLRTSE
ncbi:ATP-binding protein [Streptomyces shenzhenensis]|uniref:ATP-binding protein n=1 Tax=Streptomyces shenzhenensis TaxID=943815 RepID=UPI00381E5A93